MQPSDPLVQADDADASATEADAALIVSTSAASPQRQAVFIGGALTLVLASALLAVVHMAHLGPALKASLVKSMGTEEDTGSALKAAGARAMLTLGGRLGRCFEKDAAYLPLDMEGVIPTAARNSWECQDRCFAKAGCASFSFDYLSMVCHLQDSSARLRYRQVPFIAGNNSCPRGSAGAAVRTTTTTRLSTTTVAVRTKTTTTATRTSTRAAATTTTTTTTRTATNTTSSTAPPSTRPRGPVPVSLFCFLVIMPTGYEPGLVRAQVAAHAGVFQCDEYAAFSVGALDLGANVHTEVIKGVPSQKGAWGSWLNTGNFLLTWDKIIAMGRFRKHDWIVKVDADCVFFPDRLRAHLRKFYPTGTRDSIYIKNCPKDFGMMGSLEIFSRGAVERYSKHNEICLRRLHPNGSGEDGYMQACMWLSGVRPKQDFDLLVDNYCGYGSCTSSGWNVGFHPYKDTGSWFQCWGAAKTVR